MIERPRFIYAYAEMAHVAKDVRKNRSEGDPVLVAAGKLSAEEAATRLQISTAIAVDWAHYARIDLLPIKGATDEEKVADLMAVLSSATKRRDHARQAVVSEYGEQFFVRSMAELWALVDMHDTTTARVLPYLHWESYAAAPEAMLWWQQRAPYCNRRAITFATIELRKRPNHPPENCPPRTTSRRYASLRGAPDGAHAFSVGYKYPSSRVLIGFWPALFPKVGFKSGGDKINKIGLPFLTYIVIMTKCRPDLKIWTIS